MIDAEERLTVKPRHSDGFDQHSEQDGRSCCIVVQQCEHVDPALQEEREGGHINMCVCERERERERERKRWPGQLRRYLHGN